MAIVYQHIRKDKNCVFYIGVEYDTNCKIAFGKRSRKKHGRSESAKLRHKLKKEKKRVRITLS